MPRVGDAGRRDVLLACGGSGGDGGAGVTPNRAPAFTSAATVLVPEDSRGTVFYSATAPAT